MIRAGEFLIPEAPAKPAPYFRRRIGELVDEGKAVIRETGRKPVPQKTRDARIVERLARGFATRLAAMQDALVYYSAAHTMLSFRRVNPRPALNGKVHVPKLPADAILVGHYAYPHSRARFARDLVEAMNAARATGPPTIHVEPASEPPSVLQRTEE